MGSPDLKMSHINFSMAEDCIQNAMFELLQSEAKSFPSFQMEERYRGFRIISCGNDSSLNFLKETVCKIGK